MKNDSPSKKESPSGTRGTTIIDSHLSTWTIKSGVMFCNDVDSGGRGSTYLYFGGQVFGLGTDNNWWVHPMPGWKLFGSQEPSVPPLVVPDPPPAVPPPTKVESADGTRGNTLIDSQLHVWTINGNELIRDNADTGGRGSEYIYYAHEVYALGTDHNWWVYRSDQWTLFGDHDPIPLPVRPMVQTQTGVNMTGFGAYSGVDPFINKFKRSSRWWNFSGPAGRPDYSDPKTNWLTRLDPGEDIRLLITVNDVGGELDLGEQRAGEHLLLHRDDLKMSIAGTGVEEGSEAVPGRYSFNIPATVKDDTGALKYANPYLIWTISNRVEGARSIRPFTENGVQYPALIHANDEADFLAGKRYQRGFINSLSGAKIVRPMDWNGSVTEGVSQVAGHEGEVTVASILPEHYMTDQDRTYVWPQENNRFFPPEEIGNLAREANVSVFNTVPTKTSDEAFHYWIQKFLEGSGSWPHELLSELGDENWNYAFPWNIGGQHLINNVAPFIVVVDIDGKPSTVGVDMIGCGAAERSLKMWAIMEQYVPRERHKRVLGGQWAWTSGMGGMLSYRDPVTGQRAGDMADYYAVAPYFGPDTGEFTLDDLLTQQAWAFGDQWWIDAFNRNIDVQVSRLKMNLDFLARYAPSIQLTTYECGVWWSYAMPRSGQPRYTEARTLHDYMAGFMGGAGGKTIYQLYWDKLIKGNFAHMMQFQDQADTLGQISGLHPHQHRPDTQRQALFRSF